MAITLDLNTILAAVVALGSVGSAIAAGRSAKTAKLAIESQISIAERQLETNRELGKLQTWASVVSTSRQRWIDALRDDVAEFLTLDASYKGFDRYPSQDPDINHRANLAANDLQRQQMLLLRRINLRLNPTEEAHTALYASLSAILGMDRDQSADGAERVVKITQKILKSEWDRIRREAAGN